MVRVRIRVRVRVRWLRPNPLMHTSCRVIWLNGVRSDDLPCECRAIPRRADDHQPEGTNWVRSFHSHPLSRLTL